MSASEVLSADFDDDYPVHRVHYKKNKKSRAHGGGAGPSHRHRGDAMQDDDEASPAREHGNDTLNFMSGDPCRAPEDMPTFFEDGEEITDDFPAIFSMDAGGADGGDAAVDLGREDLQHSWVRLNQLINTNLSQGMEVATIVELVYEFYERYVRSEFDDAPIWSKKSISRYILRNSPNSRERQCDQVIDSLYATINLLRDNVAMKDKETEKITPNMEAIKTLLITAKTHASLVDARLKRLKTNNA